MILLTAVFKQLKMVILEKGYLTRRIFFIPVEPGVQLLASSDKLSQMGSNCFLGLCFVNMHIHQSCHIYQEKKQQHSFHS